MVDEKNHNVNIFLLASRLLEIQQILHMFRLTKHNSTNNLQYFLLDKFIAFFFKKIDKKEIFRGKISTSLLPKKIHRFCMCNFIDW
jgi:hypothetical protein